MVLPPSALTNQINSIEHDEALDAKKVTLVGDTTKAFSGGSNTRPEVTNVSASILAANSSRKYAVIFNQTGVQVFIKLGATAVVNEGIRLGNNEMYEIKGDNLWTGAVNAVKVTAASVNLDVFEGT